MKFVIERPFADPDATARKLVEEIANGIEAVQDGNDGPDKVACAEAGAYRAVAAGRHRSRRAR